MMFAHHAHAAGLRSLIALFFTKPDFSANFNFLEIQVQHTVFVKIHLPPIRLRTILSLLLWINAPNSSFQLPLFYLLLLDNSDQIPLSP